MSASVAMCRSRSASGFLLTSLRACVPEVVHVFTATCCAQECKCTSAKEVKTMSGTPMPMKGSNPLLMEASSYGIEIAYLQIEHTDAGVDVGLRTTSWSPSD